MSLQDERFRVNKILSVMKTFITEKLQENELSAQGYVELFLGFVEVDDAVLSDNEWFNDTFPSSLIMAEIVEAYKIISNFQQ